LLSQYASVCVARVMAKPSHQARGSQTRYILYTSWIQQIPRYKELYAMFQLVRYNGGLLDSSLEVPVTIKPIKVLREIK
jgi:hypothetical protein